MVVNGGQDLHGNKQSEESVCRELRIKTQSALLIPLNHQYKNQRLK